MKSLLLLSLLVWSQLPPVPDERGFAGSFAGVSQGALIVAGGTHFIGKMPWEGGSKLWYDTIYALDKPDGNWRVLGRLPKANGYGVSITTPEGLIIVGGGNATEHFRDVFRLENGATLPPLPKPCAFMSGCLLGDVIHIAGGIEAPAATSALNTFWSLDLKKSGARWQELPPCPGKPRILGCMAAANNAVHLFSGAALSAGPDGKPVREWLDDAWRYTKAGGWEKLPAMPRKAVAAPSPAPVAGSKILIIGGDDGANADFEPKSKHPGFPRDVLAFDFESQSWENAGEAPFSLVTTTAVTWNGRIIIPGGEARPGVRSPRVWSADAGALRTLPDTGMKKGGQ
ncbi:MAG: galactose oxidase [Verrucomicrobiaceae bacterium]|nr:galactose oxidase [Verrucomicrobiaceae bacterium]